MSGDRVFLEQQHFPSLAGEKVRCGRAYNAAAKLVTAVDEMLESLIAMV